MDDPSTSPWWWLVLAGCAAVYACTAFTRVAFRMLGPVTLGALVERIGPDRTEFLRKSLRAPTAFWFSLTLANLTALVGLLVVFFGCGFEVRWGGVAFALRPVGRWGHDALLFVVLLGLLATAELVMPVVAARVDRVWFVERALGPLRAVHGLFSPLSELLARWSVEEDEDEDEQSANEEVQAYITVGTREGILEEGEGELLRNLLLFGETRVREVMTPRTEVVGIEKDATVDHVVERMASTRFSRIPVHEGQLDSIVGVAHLKDAVLALQGGRGDDPVTTLMHEPYIVPDSKRVAELLRDLQARRQQLAIVVDEFGGTAGIVTVEDLLEELVGEIREEHERGEDVVKASDGTWLVRGRASLHDVGEALGADLETEGSSTVGGLLLSLCDRVPARGETVEHAGWRFRVEDGDRRRILLVRIASAEQARLASEAAQRDGMVG